jgi:hypothetical protein
MNKVQRIGGISAISLAIIYIIGIVMNFSMLDTSSIKDSVELVRFMESHEALMYIWITLLYVVFGIVLVALSLSIYEKLKEKSEYGAKLATSFGLIWAGLVIASGMIHNVGMGMAIKMLQTNPEGAGQFYGMINAIHVGLGGGNEIPGALWTLLISIIAIKYKLYSRWINDLGIIVGVAGILTIVPLLFDYTVMVFALGQMVWWVGLGIHMIRNRV